MQSNPLRIGAAPNPFSKPALASVIGETSARSVNERETLVMARALALPKSDEHPLNVMG
jgi:hypothetical protein